MNHRPLSMNNRGKITAAVLTWAVIPTSVLLYFVTTLWPKAPGVADPSQPADESTAVALVMILGKIGGYIRWMNSLRIIVFDPEAIWQWMLDSALTPLMGAALALVFCIAFRAGLTVQTAGAANVNWIGIYALAGVVGLFSPDAVKRLAATFESLFAPNTTRESKDVPEIKTGRPATPTVVPKPDSHETGI